MIRRWWRRHKARDARLRRQRLLNARKNLNEMIRRQWW